MVLSISLLVLSISSLALLLSAHSTHWPSHIADSHHKTHQEWQERAKGLERQVRDAARESSESSEALIAQLKEANTQLQRSEAELVQVWRTRPHTNSVCVFVCVCVCAVLHAEQDQHPVPLFPLSLPPPSSLLPPPSGTQVRGEHAEAARKAAEEFLARELALSTDKSDVTLQLQRHLSSVTAELHQDRLRHLQESQDLKALHQEHVRRAQAGRWVVMMLSLLWVAVIVVMRALLDRETAPC